MEIEKKNRIIISTGIIIGTIAILATMYPANMQTLYLKNYIINSICLIVSLSLIIYLYCRFKIDMFSPFLFFSFLYILMFFITPIYDILTGEILWFGTDLFEYGIKGSLYALLGYFFFWLMYSTKFVLGKKEISYNNYFEKSKYIIDKKIIIFIFIGYMVCFGANVIYMVFSSGNSLTYILTLGVFGQSSTVETVADIGIISMLSYALPSFTLLYIEFGKNKWLKVLSFVIMFQLQVARGFRFFILQIVVMFAAYYYIKQKKKPKFIQLLIIVLLTMIPLVIMTMFRNSIRSGGGMDLAILSRDAILEALDAAFWENLRIYKNYYALIKVVPNRTSYLFGAQMIVYTAIMFIPRAIWKGKPGNPGTEAQKIALGEAAVLGGSAYPALGEYYYECGVFGIVFWMSVFGAWARRFENRYRYNACSVIDTMVYVTLLGSILQLVIRGYTPSNFWMLVFSLLPYWIIKKIFVQRRNE